MVSVPSLWLPILLSAVLVFALSSIVHMLLPYHRSDFGKLLDEDEVMEALGRFDIPPGDYMIPCAGSASEMRSPAYAEKVSRGPVALVTVMGKGWPSMATSLLQWIAYCLFAGALVAFVAGRALGPGAPYVDVFQIAGGTAFACYAVALFQNSIWYKREWGSTLKSAFDGLIYALFTAGVFGWLWPA